MGNGASWQTNSLISSFNVWQTVRVQCLRCKKIRSRASTHSSPSLSLVSSQFYTVEVLGMVRCHREKRQARKSRKPWFFLWGFNSSPCFALLTVSLSVGLSELSGCKGHQLTLKIIWKCDFSCAIDDVK